MAIFNRFNLDRESKNLRSDVAFSVHCLVTGNSKAQQKNLIKAMAKKFSTAKVISQQHYLELIKIYYSHLEDQVSPLISKEPPEKIDKIVEALSKIPYMNVNVAKDHKEMIDKVLFAESKFQETIKNKLAQQKALKDKKAKQQAKEIIQGETFEKISLDESENFQKNNENVDQQAIKSPIPNSKGMIKLAKLHVPNNILSWFSKNHHGKANKKIQLWNRGDHQDKQLNWIVDMAVDHITKTMTNKKLSSMQQKNLVINIANLTKIIKENPAIIVNIDDKYPNFNQMIEKITYHHLLPPEVREAAAKFAATSQNINAAIDHDFIDSIKAIAIALKNEDEKSLQNFIKHVFDLKDQYMDQAHQAADQKVEQFQNLITDKMQQMDHGTLQSIANSLDTSHMNAFDKAMTFYQQFAHFYDDQGGIVEDAREDNQISLQAFLQDFKILFDSLKAIVNDQLGRTPVKHEQSKLQQKWIYINTPERAQIEEDFILLGKNGQAIKNALFTSSNRYIQENDRSNNVLRTPH